MMKKLLSLILALPLLAPALRAQALPLLYNPTDARSLALGGTGIAWRDGAASVDQNLSAAALSARSFAAGLSYAHWAPSIGADSRFSMGSWYRSGTVAFGLSAKGSFARPATLYGAAGEPGEEFAPYDLAVALGAAWKAAPGLAVSANARVVSSSLGEQATGTSVCADLAAQYASGPFRAGLGLSNLGAAIRYGSSSYPLPLLARGGFTYNNPWVDATLELDYLARAGLMAGIGVEARPLEKPGQAGASWLALRAGYHYGPADKGLPSFGSVGIGLEFSGLAIDFAYLFAHPALGGSLSAGLSYSF